MNEKSMISENLSTNEFQGMYGKFTINLQDQKEVNYYRISILLCAISFCLLLIQWVWIGPVFAWIWLVPMAISLGLLLKWIHIYIRALHNALITLWGLGCLGILALLFISGPNYMLSNLETRPLLEILIGPFFAALTGVGFKEFFCFRKPEAIGMTLFLPIGLLGHLLGVMNPSLVMTLLMFSAMLLLILSLRKFGSDPAIDIGDKSVFEYLKNQNLGPSSSI